jgi:hypothetical protein
MVEGLKLAAGSDKPMALDFGACSRDYGDEVQSDGP